MRKTMRPMGRPRKHNKDLPPGLYCYPGRNCYIRIGEMKPVDLGTRDRDEAKAIYWAFQRSYAAEQATIRAEAVASALDAAAKGADRITVGGYADTWRTTRLPTLLKKDGKPLSPKTRADYNRMLQNQVAKHAPFQDLAIGELATKHCRQFLATWIGSPHFYNYMKSLLSRFLQHAVDKGLLDANPIEHVNRRPVEKREVYIPMDHYLAITAQLAEWEARACDLIYLVSHRPGDVLRLQDREPDVSYSTRRGKRVVVLTFHATKNDQAMEIVDDAEREGGIEATLAWFRRWKKDQGFVGVHHAIVYPTTSRRRSIGKPVSVGYLSKAFAAAIVAAGIEKGRYTLRDLRKKGLTDEARIAGKATNKGGHKTEQMREYYVVGGLPQRARSNLAVLRRTP